MHKALVLTAAPGSAASWDLPERARRAIDKLLGPMLAITTAMCTSFKSEILQALHNLAAGSSHNFRMALYDASADLSATTTVYAAANEVVGTGYTAGGQVLTKAGVATSGTTAFADFDDVVWTGSTFSTRGALIFNNTSGNRALGAFDFGANVSVTAGNLTVSFPTANATAAVLRIA